MATKLRLKTSVNPGRLGDDLARKVRAVIVDEMLAAADELQNKTPVGATGSLRAGWDVLEPRRSPVSFEISGSIVNTAPQALSRIAGRGQGTAPPIAPIKSWTEAKGLPPKAAWAIARKIAKSGTARWRAQDNFAGIDDRGRVKPDSPIREAERRILQRINTLRG